MSCKYTAFLWSIIVEQSEANYSTTFRIVTVLMGSIICCIEYGLLTDELNYGKE